MEKVLLVAALACWLGSITVEGVPPACSGYDQYPVTPRPALPMLPTTAFKSVIRAEFVNRQITTEAVEYVDEDANAATVVVTQGGQAATVIMSYSTNEVFYVIPNPTPTIQIAGPQFCLVKNMSTDDNTQLFGMKTDNTGGYPHLYSTNKILSFINGTEVYKGVRNISGIPTDRFTSCLYWPELNSNFTLDYYFTVNGWTTPSGLNQIPLRAEIQGTRFFPNNGSSFNFHHIYQYVNFEPYVNDPEAIFSTPPGVYCLMRKNVRSLPKLNTHFYYREEISSPPSIDGAGGTLSESDIWYDSDLQLIRFDERDAPNGISKDLSQSNGPYRIVHDYGVGVQYTIATDINECSVDPIPYNAKGFDGVLNITRKTLGMRNSTQFFNLDSSSYLYAGTRKARGQVCDVFQAVLTNLPGHGIVIYEVYFLSGANDITDRGSGDNPYDAVPMRILMWESGHLVTQYEIHDFDQYSPQANNFDVTACYQGGKSIDFEIFISVQNTQLMPQMSPYVNQLMRLEVSINVGISPVRVQRTRLHWGQRNVYFEGTLLDAAPSYAKYEYSANTVMASGVGKALQSIMSYQDCSSQCDNLQEWKCVQFDYCPSTHVCTLGRNAVASLQNNTKCNHYQRVLGGGFDVQVPLASVWQSLKNQVYGKQLVFSLPNPNSGGFVDINQDTTNLDDTQKVTFSAFKITDQVVSTVNRNFASSGSVMTQFKALPKKQGKGYNTLLRGLSVDDCASNCVNEQSYNCQSFAYCWDAGACFMSKQHPDERPDMLKDSSACDLYVRDYTSNFQQFPGQTVLSASNTIYQNVKTASQCAKLCTYYSTFHCESFDFCTDISTCYLGQTHYYDAPKANIKQVPSCAHFSRNYIQDFVSKSHKQVPLRDNRVVQSVTPQQCAKLCVQEGSFTCNSFDYCGNFSECRLSDASVSNVGQVTLESTAYCDVYMRQFSTGSGQSSSGSGSSSSSSSKYSPGAMAGLGISMIVVGLILGLVGLVLYNRFVGGRGGADGMAISFTKHENE